MFEVNDKIASFDVTLIDDCLNNAIFTNQTLTPIKFLISPSTTSPSTTYFIPFRDTISRKYNW